jgi:hypothetical protein
MELRLILTAGHSSGLLSLRQAQLVQWILRRTSLCPREPLILLRRANSPHNPTYEKEHNHLGGPAGRLISVKSRFLQIVPRWHRCFERLKADGLSYRKIAARLALEGHLTWRRTRHPTADTCAMPKETKTREQLAEIIMSEARASGKCADLHSVHVIGPIDREYTNWDIAPSSNHPTRLVSALCRAELNVILGRLQAQYDLSGD